MFTVVYSHCFCDREGEEDEQLNAMMKNFSKSLQPSWLVNALYKPRLPPQSLKQTHRTLTVVFLGLCESACGLRLRASVLKVAAG